MKREILVKANDINDKQDDINNVLENLKITTLPDITLNPGYFGQVIVKGDVIECNIGEGSARKTVVLSLYGDELKNLTEKYKQGIIELLVSRYNKLEEELEQL